MRRREFLGTTAAAATGLALAPGDVWDRSVLTATPDPQTVALTVPQSRVFEDPARFRVWIAGRRSGKSTEMLVEHVHRALTQPGYRGWYIGPTYTQSKKVAWKPLKAMLHPSWLTKVNESELLVEFKNGSEVALRGADNPDSLRGVGLDMATLDEFAFMDPDGWHEVIRPALSDRQGRAIFGTTPRGFNWAYDMYLLGRNPDHPDWSTHTCTTTEAGIVPLEEVEAARAILDPRQFRQEYEASFESLSGRVYDQFERDANVSDEADDHGGTLYVGMDFNVNPMSAVLATRAGDEAHIFDALEIMTSNTDELATEIRGRFPDRDIVVCPDPSGNARKTSAPVGQTDFTILKRHGFKVVADKAAPPVVDRVNNVQANACTADGRRRLLVHPRADKLIRALDGLTYKEGTSQIDKKLGLDHITDALGYLLWQESNLLVNRSVGLRRGRIV